MTRTSLGFSVDDVPHGDDLHCFSGRIHANFSSNVWPYGMSQGLRQALGESLLLAQSYPPPHAETQCLRLSDKLGYPLGGVMALNGAVEGIYLVAQAFSGMQSHVVVPTFGEYERACRLHGHRLSFIAEEVFAGSVKLAKGLWWICNPNNPTGTIYSAEWLQSLIASNPQCVFVVDEAYMALSLQGTSLLPVAKQHRNVLVLVSLTKAYAMPGIRAGYLAGHPELIRAIRAFQPPWSVGVPALAAITYAIDTPPFPQGRLFDYLQCAQHLQDEIDALDGFKVHRTPMGFFLIETPFIASELKNWLVEQHGLLVRDASSFRGIGPNMLRVSCQSVDHNRLLMGALQRVLIKKQLDRE
ncbi:MAG: aminotransferase class I/II-fold pyridoxal phosphate-dependent enzyme [Breznakibacter sp.]